MFYARVHIGKNVSAEMFEMSHEIVYYPLIFLSPSVDMYKDIYFFTSSINCSRNSLLEK